MYQVSISRERLKLTRHQQPTEFWLDVHPIAEVFDTPELIQNLAEFAGKLDRIRPVPLSSSSGTKESLLFLHVRAAADFFTTNKELMSNPPPVNLDIILDSYVFNVFPKSLGPTAAYIGVLAVGAWFVSGFAWKFLRPDSTDKAHKD